MIDAGSLFVSSFWRTVIPMVIPHTYHRQLRPRDISMKLGYLRKRMNEETT